MDSKQAEPFDIQAYEEMMELVFAYTAAAHDFGFTHKMNNRFTALSMNASFLKQALSNADYEKATAKATLVSDSINNKDLWATFVPLTLLGMFGTQTFAFAEHGLRGLYLGGKTASIIDPTIGILRYSQPIMFIVLITIFIAIYKIAARKESGWWFSMVAGLGMAVAAFPVHFARPKASFSVAGADAFAKGAKVVGAGTPSVFTSVYFLGGLLGVIFIVVMLTPYFKNYYLSENKN
ncbi:MAG: hypothetical protein HOC81_08860 [Candidatus Marinimicrobia bacterium]|nr:hypothetical protein [Candidatus Neomarinimicrobiota bacterium]